MRIGIFGDIHFSLKGIDRIVATGNWIIEEFKRQGVERVVCLGDALVTREDVNVEAQSEAISFFKKLTETLNVEVHVVLGNHDMNLKHARKVSSLDCLTLHPGIDLYREPTIVGDMLLMPYHEDPTEIVRYIKDLEDRQNVGNLTVYGHFGLNGAVQNTRYNTRFAGAIGPDLFKSFKRTFVGHFHVHQDMEHRVTFVGSPMQFNFGDCGDERGIMIYDDEKEAPRFVVNPHHDAFLIVDAKSLKDLKPEDVKDRFITVLHDDVVTDKQEADTEALLTSMGALQVRGESVVEKAIREHVVDVGSVESVTAEGLVESFVKSVLTDESQLIPDAVVALGKGIIREVNALANTISASGSIFDGQIAKVTMENFLGVQGKIEVSFADMVSGVWYIEGQNGHGKSTLLEAIVWCYFGEFIRSDTVADDAVNDVAKRNTRVVVEHANGYAIERYRKHTTLGAVGVRVYKDGAYQEKMDKGSPAATQQCINELLGTDYGKMIKTNILGQNLTSDFISSGEKERRAMIEKMLGLEMFDAYLEKVRSIKKDLSTQAESQEGIQRIQSGINADYGRKILEMQSKVQEAEKQHQENLNRIENNRRQDEKKLSELPAKADMDAAAAEAQVKADREAVAKAEVNLQVLQDVEQKIAVVRNELFRCSEKKAMIKRADEQFKLDVNTLVSDRNSLNVTIAKLEGEINGLKSINITEEKAVHARINELTAKSSEVAYQQVQTLAEKEREAKNAAVILAEIKRLEDIAANGGQCPTCTQPVVADNLSASIAEKKTKWSACTDTVQNLTTIERNLVRSRDEVTAEIQKLRTSVHDESTLAVISTKLDSLENLARISRDQLAQIPAKAQAKQAALITNLSTIVGQPAQTTEQADGFVDAVVDRLVKEEAAIRGPITKEAPELAKQGLQRAKEALQASEGILARVRATFEAEMASLRQRLGSYDQELIRAVDQNPVKTVQDSIKSLQAGQQKAFDEMEAAKKLAHNISQKQAYVLFWEKAFASKGSMRSYLLDDSVQRLNMLLSGYTSQHFGGKMTLTFTPELTLKERYGRRSGGQRRWSSLCALLALFELSRQKSRYRSAFLALDEVFDALDIHGRRAVVEIINIMAVRVRHILVISHVDLPGATRAGSIRVHMDDAGTHMAVCPQ
jgi:DNA repair exonuclease SbcCD ATPase subunit/predicted phosphodiesterase